MQREVFGDFRYHIPLMYLATPRHQPDVGGATYIQPQQLQLISWSVLSNTWYNNNKMIVLNPSIDYPLDTPGYESIPLWPNLREAGPRLRLNHARTRSSPKGKTGMKYHEKKGCFKANSHIAIEEAESFGHSPCRKCLKPLQIPFWMFLSQ